MIFAVAMATEEAKYILTTFLLVLSGTDHCVKVSSNSETMRAEIFWWLQRIDIKYYISKLFISLLHIQRVLL